MNIRYPGKIVFKEVRNSINTRNIKHYLDQLNFDKDIWLGPNEIIKYLKTNYNLTTEEYYNLVVYGEKSHEYTCPICKKPITKFLGLCRGYHETCSIECSGKMTYKKIVESGRISYMETPEFREKSKNAVKNLFKTGEHPFQQVEKHARSRKTDFIKKASSLNRTEAILYWAELDNNTELFKIGISTDLTGNYYDVKKCHHYKSVNIIIQDTIEKIADIEYKIKIHFNQKVEYYNLSKFNEILEYINLLNSTTK